MKQDAPKRGPTGSESMRSDHVAKTTNASLRARVRSADHTGSNRAEARHLRFDDQLLQLRHARSAVAPRLHTRRDLRRRFQALVDDRVADRIASDAEARAHGRPGVLAFADRLAKEQA